MVGDFSHFHASPPLKSAPSLVYRSVGSWVGDDPAPSPVQGHSPSLEGASRDRPLHAFPAPQILGLFHYFFTFPKGGGFC